MYRPQSKQVSVFENESFFQFQGLNPDNDWVRLAKLILILDATPQDIRYPTDISLLNEARECLEGMIDRVFPKGQKPCSYRRIARRDYLRYAKNRRPSLKLLRKQLSYVARNLGYLSEVKENKRLRELLFALFQRAFQALVWCRRLVVTNLLLVCRAKFENGYCSVDTTYKKYDPYRLPEQLCSVHRRHQYSRIQKPGR